MTGRYGKSEDLLARALQSIPLGSQTFSKSRVAFPYGVSPYFLERGQGSHVWDVDGNEYVDFINSLLAISLGHNDPDVNRAVEDQLRKGVLFSLPHRIEAEVAEQVIDMVPCAEMVRFAKNGSDATAGAVRLARAVTGRERVAVCGYHGWQDWYIGSTTRDLGVPEATKRLTQRFVFNDTGSLDSLFDEHPGEYAAVILEPMNTTYPAAGFLEYVRDATHRHGALLVFDETITGFRFANGGAQELFGVTPDLATFGKGVANGYPLAILAGRRGYMKLLDEIFFSFTFGGETLSLAAAGAVMKKLLREPVIRVLEQRGRVVMERLEALVAQYRLSDVFGVCGHPSWSFLTIKDVGTTSQFEIRTFFLQEMFLRGILINGTHNISYAHTDEDIEKLTTTYDEVLALVRASLDRGDLLQRIHGEILKPLFKVR
jgi:glutamate-1-semialdehyde 2,1-aminomutase